MVKDRLVSLSMIGVTAFLLLVSLFFSAALTAAQSAFDGVIANGTLLAKGINFFASFVLTGAMFAMIFKLLPHARPKWADVWEGAAFTAVLFAVGKYLIGLYLGRAAVGSAFGAAGSLVVLIVWVYYSTQILVFGAEITKVAADRRTAASTPAAAG
jgi:membrane protein